MAAFLIGIMVGWVSFVGGYSYLNTGSFMRDVRRVKDVLKRIVRRVKYFPLIGKTRHYEWNATYDSTKKG